MAAQRPARLEHAADAALEVDDHRHQVVDARRRHVAIDQLTRVAAYTPVISPHRYRAMSMTCEPRSPSAPAPDSGQPRPPAEVVGGVGGVVLQHPAAEVAHRTELARVDQLAGPGDRRPRCGSRSRPGRRACASAGSGGHVTGGLPVWAIGFSQITCLPWASASQATSAWNTLGTHTSTTSMSSARVIWCQSSWLRS